MENVKGFIIDLDGVVWKGSSAIAGSEEAIRAIRMANKQVAFVSNNSAMSRAEALAKLNRMQIDANLEEIIIAPYITAQYVSKQNPGSKVFVVGLPGLADEMANVGLRCVTDPL